VARNSGKPYTRPMGFPEAIAKAQRAAIATRIEELRAEARMLEDGLAASEPHHIGLSGDRFAALRRAIAQAHDALELAHTLATRD
jgi:hypothetical protein